MLLTTLTKPRVVRKGGDYENDDEGSYEWIHWTLSHASFWVILLAILVACSLLNCYIEQRRDEARLLKRSRKS